MLFISATDTYGIEQAARLFPFRTGVAIPDWLVIDSGRAENFGAAGVLGAGSAHLTSPLFF